jgi:hypothetical protein
MSEAWHFTQRLTADIFHSLKSSFAIYGDLIHFVCLVFLLLWIIFERSMKYIFSKPLDKNGEAGFKIKIPLGILILKLCLNSGKKGSRIKCGLSVAFISLKISINPQSWWARPKVKLKFSFWLSKYTWEHKGSYMRFMKYNTSSNTSYRKERKITQIVSKSVSWADRAHDVGRLFMKPRRSGRQTSMRLGSFSIRTVGEIVVDKSV